LFLEQNYRRSQARVQQAANAGRPSTRQLIGTRERVSTLPFDMTVANNREAPMGLAEYMIVSKPDGWTVLHDGTAQHDYDTKEAAFEAAVAAASLAIRQGHEVHLSVPGREAGNKTALGAKDSQSVS
jgi:sarcosine oxidase gamma subunit